MELNDASSFQSRDNAALKTMKLIHSESQRQGGLRVLLLTVKATTVCLHCAKHSHWHVWMLTGGRFMYSVLISSYMEAVDFMFFFALLQRNLSLPEPINKICHTKTFLKFSWAQVIPYCSYYDTVPFLSCSHLWKGEVGKILWYFILSQCSAFLL